MIDDEPSVDSFHMMIDWKESSENIIHRAFGSMAEAEREAFILKEQFGSGTIIRIGPAQACTRCRRNGRYVSSLPTLDV